MQPLLWSFVYLGHKFFTTENIIHVPDNKRLFFVNYRSPRSKAECLSRLGSLKYYDNFFPLLNVIALPIQRMAHGKDEFYWDNSLEKSWQAIKLIASLQMSNSTIDQDKTLFLACDAGGWWEHYNDHYQHSGVHTSIAQQKCSISWVASNCQWCNWPRSNHKKSPVRGDYIVRLHLIESNC